MNKGYFNEWHELKMMLKKIFAPPILKIGILADKNMPLELIGEFEIVLSIKNGDRFFPHVTINYFLCLTKFYPSMVVVPGL
jgi:hypothetical protein